MKQNRVPKVEYHKGEPSDKKPSPYRHDRIVDETVVNDPMGYWNPDNFGKIVQFSAPNGRVSMNNVNFPVMAISNKGEYNMQMPGQEYQYKGDFITEYPMAKNGGWLDSLPMAENGIGNIPYMGVRVPYSNRGFQGSEPNLPVSRPEPFDDNLLVRQQFKESTFRPNAVSRAGARGLAQIKSDVESDAIKAGVIKQGDDIFNPEVNKKVQKWYMNNLFDSSFINKKGKNQSDSVKMAKTLAAYNWGRGNLLGYLNKQKEKGIDIYDSYDWIESLPKETKDYVNKILLKKDPKFEAEFSKAYKNYSYAYGGIPMAQDGEEFSDYQRPGPVATGDSKDSFGYMTRKTAAKKSLPTKKSLTKTPEEWEKEIRAVEKRIGNPSTWTLDSYKTLQDKLNEYKAWRENTPEGRAVVDYHNEPGEYEVPLPSHLKNNKQKSKETPVSANIEDNDSWLENIAEIIDPTGISSWDDVYRAYKNKGLSGETATEALGALPLLGKAGKLSKPGIHIAKYAGLDKLLFNKLPKNKYISNAFNTAGYTGRISDAEQAVFGSKDNSGFTWDMRHGEVPKFGGRNIFPQIQLGEHGDYAYGGDPSLPNIEGHYKTGGWLDAYDDEYRRGGQRRRRGTSKNIKSSINDLFRRNYDVYGPAGKNRYDPTAYKTGGWLDNID